MGVGGVYASAHTFFPSFPLKLNSYNNLKNWRTRKIGVTNPVFAFIIRVVFTPIFLHFCLIFTNRIKYTDKKDVPGISADFFVSGA